MPAGRALVYKVRRGTAGILQFEWARHVETIEILHADGRARNPRIVRCGIPPAGGRALPVRLMPTIVVMGVSGSGKSHVGAALARACGVGFVEGDELHPAANIAKMRAGIPLDDADRQPWLAAIAAAIAAHRGQGVVVACSALRRAYRDVLRQADPSLRLLYLRVARDELARRMRGASTSCRSPCSTASWRRWRNRPSTSARWCWKAQAMRLPWWPWPGGGYGRPPRPADELAQETMHRWPAWRLCLRYGPPCACLDAGRRGGAHRFTSAGLSIGRAFD